MMWGVLRAALGVLLVCVVVFLVISPYVDPPLTVLRARQIAVGVLAVMSVCWEMAANRQPLRGAERVWPPAGHFPDTHPLRLITLLC
jgi:hypothetical protein